MLRVQCVSPENSAPDKGEEYDKNFDNYFHANKPNSSSELGIQRWE